MKSGARLYVGLRIELVQEKASTWRQMSDPFFRGGGLGPRRIARIPRTRLRRQPRAIQSSPRTSKLASRVADISRGSGAGSGAVDAGDGRGGRHPRSDGCCSKGRWLSHYRAARARRNGCGLRAVQQGTQRPVALKMMTAAGLSSDRAAAISKRSGADGEPGAPAYCTRLRGGPVADTFTTSWN